MTNRSSATRIARSGGDLGAQQHEHRPALDRAAEIERARVEGRALHEFVQGEVGAAVDDQTDRAVLGIAQQQYDRVLEDRAADLLGGDQEATGGGALGFRLWIRCVRRRDRGAEQHRDRDRESDRA